MGGQDQMHAERTPDPGNADQAGDEIREFVHQLGELVDHQNQPGQADLAARSGSCSQAVFTSTARSWCRQVSRRRSSASREASAAGFPGRRGS